MKYMILLYGSQQDLDALAGRPGPKPPMPAADVAALHDHMRAYHQGLVDSGEFVDARGLSAPVHARRVELRGGVQAVTDGPYPETQEVLVGYTIVECAGYDRATEIAAGLLDPGDGDGYVDVRPLIESVEDLD